MRVWSEPRLFAAASAAKAKRLRLLHFTSTPVMTPQVPVATATVVVGAQPMALGAQPMAVPVNAVPVSAHAAPMPVHAVPPPGRMDSFGTIAAHQEHLGRDVALFEVSKSAFFVRFWTRSVSVIVSRCIA